MNRRRPDPKAIGKRIAKARKGVELSQSQLADRVGLEAQTISKYERGVLSPSADSLFRIADECTVNPRWLQTGTDG